MLQKKKKKRRKKNGTEKEVGGGIKMHKRYEENKEKMKRRLRQKENGFICALCLVSVENTDIDSRTEKEGEVFLFYFGRVIKIKWEIFLSTNYF